MLSSHMVLDPSLLLNRRGQVWMERSLDAVRPGTLHISATLIQAVADAEFDALRTFQAQFMGYRSPSASFALLESQRLVRRTETPNDIRSPSDMSEQIAAETLAALDGG